MLVGVLVLKTLNPSTMTWSFCVLVRLKAFSRCRSRMVSLGRYQGLLGSSLTIWTSPPGLMTPPGGEAHWVCSG